MKERRYAKLGFTPQAFGEMLIQGSELHFVVVRDGLPKDAHVVSAIPDSNDQVGAQRVWLLIESKEFEPVPEGGVIPELPAPVIEGVPRK